MIDEFLSRLQKVKKIGPDRWAACCPAHDDSNPSMNIKAVDGKLLVICRAGCTQEEILSALGVDWSALYEARPHPYQRAASKAFPAADVLRALESEALIVAVSASNLANGVELSEKDRERLMIAYQRIYAAKEMAVGS